MFHQIADKVFFMPVRPYLTEEMPQCAQPLVLCKTWHYPTDKK